MKRITLISIMITAIGLMATAQEPKKETRYLEEFDRVRVSKGVNVTLEEGDNPLAEVHIKNAELSDVIIEQQGKNLTIRMRPRVYQNMAVNVYLKYQNLREVSVGLGGSVYSTDIIEADQLVLEAGMDGSIEIELEVKNLVVTASAARVKVTGKADYIDVRTATGGRFLGANLETKKALVRANTGGSAQVWVTEKLEAIAGSGARIEYTGNPVEVEAKQTLGGKVEKLQ